jgi:prolipoprotein diacylglyceryl transferase
MPWRGGLAIHGALLGGGLALYWASKWRRQPFWLLAALLTPALAAAQALGRWGNYFNNELYGRETTLPWSIPVFNQAGQVLFYAHPVFLYESLLNAVLALLLWWRLAKAPALATDRHQQQRWLLWYLGAYSLIRFLMEFWRQDHAPELWGWRWPQLLSLAVFLAASLYLISDRLRRVAKK